MTQSEDIFDEIRPYRDDEVNEAIGKLIEDPEFAIFVRYLFKGIDRNELFSSFKSISSINEFQKKFVSHALDVIITRSIDAVSSTGIDQISKDKTYFLISNHRDIVLDSALINLLLYRNECSTSQVAIGGNLLISPMITNLVRLNKSFIVKRNIPPRELYNYSKLLSSYISYCLFEKKESVWIAQREGRSKDGNDKTQASLLKMITMNDEENYLKTYLNMNITPVAVSYEYDPCDIFKAIELLSLANNLPYKKTHQSDFQSMITGIQGYKGRVEVAFCKPFATDDYEKITGSHINDWLKNFAAYIDEKIYEAYRLWKTNYIAFDLLNGKGLYEDKYSEETRDKFIEYVREKTESLESTYPKDEIIRLILTMYANPLINKLHPAI